MKKYLLLILFVFSILIIDVSAEELSRRDESNNYCVNKKWQITNKNKSNILNTPYVDASTKIYDYADILTNAEEVYLNQKIAEFKDKYNTEIIILTVDKYIGDEENEVVATDFYDYNDFGLNTDNYDGILIYRNANKSVPFYGMYMFGNAQLVLSELRYNRILDLVYTNMRSGDYKTAFSSMIARINFCYQDGIPEEMKNAYIDNMGYIRYKYRPPYILAFIISLVTSISVVSVLVSKNKMIKRSTKAEAYLDLATVNYKRREDNFVSTHTTSYSVSSSSSSGGGGHSSSGGHSRSGSSGGGHSGGGRRG